MADKKKPEAFKIGDQHRKGMSAPPQKAGAKKGEAEPEAPSAGFARIEAILEKETTEGVEASLTALATALQEFESKASSAKDKGAAKRALIALERTGDLLEYLFQTKASMQNPSDTNPG